MAERPLYINLVLCPLNQRTLLFYLKERKESQDHSLFLNGGAEMEMPMRWKILRPLITAD
jgi:hypothetical protein